MKNVLIILMSMMFLIRATGQENQLILNIDPLPDNTLTAETPLVFSLQNVNEAAMENYMDQVFLNEDKTRIDSLHKAGVITDSLYQIYQDEWFNSNTSNSNSLVDPDNMTWEQRTSDGEWRPLELNVQSLNSIDQNQNSFTSNLLFYGVDPTDVTSLMQIESIRAVNNSSRSNPIKLNLTNLTQQSQASSEGQLYYISNYWVLRQDYNNALQYANRIISSYPDAFSGYFQRGVAQYHLGLKQEALATFELAFDRVTEEQFGIEPPDRLLEYYYLLVNELTQPQKN